MPALLRGIATEIVFVFDVIFSLFLDKLPHLEMPALLRGIATFGTTYSKLSKLLISLRLEMPALLRGIAT